MSGFFKKRFIKWSMISAFGISAYFLGFSLGTKELSKEIAHQAFEAHLANLKYKNDQRLANLDHRSHSHSTPQDERSKESMNEAGWSQSSTQDISESSTDDLGESKPETLIFLPTSEQTADLSQTK